jgi:ubiquitin-protein ligase
MSNIPERRFKAEVELLENLQARSKYISIEFVGNPIRRYIVTYTCTGIYRDEETKEIRHSTFHQMEVLLSEGYPRIRPHFRWMTPVFHPNIEPKIDVCIGDVWNISKTISDFLVDIGEMVQYKRYNPENAYNHEAATWVIQNKHILPIGRETLVEPEKIIPDSSRQESHSVVINNPKNVNLNIATTLSDVRQSINNIQTISENDKDDFEKLILRLMQELQKAPKDKAQDAEAVAEYAKELVEEVSKETPKKIKISISKEGLLKAAENIASVLPMVLQIAKQIINHIVVSG